MKSDLYAAREVVLPAKGAEFEVTYHDASGAPVKYGEEPHRWVSAASPGLAITVLGEGSRVCQRRQVKPLYKEGTYRTMLVIEHGSSVIHILGRHVIVTEERLNVGQVVEALTRSGQE